MQKIESLISPVARTFLALIFILSALGKTVAFEGTQAYMETTGVPGLLLAPTIAFEIGAALAVLLGWQTRIAALLLAGFSLVTAVAFHSNLGDQVQQIMFLKNVAMAGGFLLLVRYGSGHYSLDNRAGVRSARTAPQNQELRSTS